MAEALIKLLNRNIDTDSLDAAECDVYDNKTFIGSGSEVIRKGTGIGQGSPQILLPLNGTVVLPAGKYTGGKVVQSVPVMGGQWIDPTSKTITLHTKDMYMGGNIVLNPIPNLTPENIKKGEYVGGVGPGTWEGYINGDPDTFFLYGTFAPDQEIIPIRYSSSLKAGSIAQTKKSFNYVIYSSVTASDPKEIYSVFSLPIDITTKNKLKIEFEIYRNTANTAMSQFTVYGYRNKVSIFSNEKGEKIFQNQLATTREQGIMKYTKEIDLSSFSRDMYLYLYATIREPEDYIAVKKVEFV